MMLKYERHNAIKNRIEELNKDPRAHKICESDKNYQRTGVEFVLYRRYRCMMKRCYSKSYTNYKYWGGRGISVSDEWKGNPQEFIEWALLNGFDFGLTLDRIDNNSDYGPSNCRWATYSEQRRNQRDHKPKRRRGSFDEG